MSAANSVPGNCEVFFFISLKMGLDGRVFEWLSPYMLAYWFEAEGMSEHEQKELKYRHSFQRPLSLLTLFFLFAGLFLSGLNPSHEMEEMLGFDIETLSAAAAPSENPTIYITSSNQRPDDPVNSEGDDDDCLCWCAQVLAAQCFEIVSSPLQLSLIEPENSDVPAAPPQVLFHPPRVA
jgi:hypothetical protein